MFNKSQLFFIYKTKSVNLFQEMTVGVPLATLTTLTILPILKLWVKCVICLLIG